MSLETNPALRRSVIYELYVRSHTPQGTFRAVEPDLPRIRALGTDILWLMPIHPIGEANRKGSMGCPYANRDYRTVNPEYGTLEDFLHLVDAIHDNGMKCIIDVVYNHTSPDATLVALHPEYYYHKPDGSRGNKVGDWTDVVDLDYAVPGLWDYQIESLCYWAQYVDGFRCDVASTVPVAFWRKARQAVERVRPGAIWLGESVHLDHILAFRRQGFYAATDNELFDVFDILYPYDIWPLYEGAAGGTMPLSRYFAALSYQELSFPTWYNKLSCLENHDQRRAADRFPNRDSLLAWTALSYFQKGTTLLYAGQEVSANILYERLCRRYTEQAAAAAVAEMVQLDYVNDARYAEARAHSLLAARKSRRAAAQSLRQKGLAPAEVAGALEAVYAPEDGGDDPELEAAAALVDSRYRKKLAIGRRDLVVAALQRRGFAYPVIKEAIRRVEEG